MKTIYVKAAPGLAMPKEHAPRDYIIDAEAIEVTETHYYRKAISDSDLIEVTEKEWRVQQASRIKTDAVISTDSTNKQ